MNTKALVNIICGATLLVTGYSAAKNNQNIEPAANETLLEFQNRFKPQLVPMGKRVYMAYGYEYSNFSFIEGDDGVIIIDTGWYVGKVKPAIKDYRKIIGKPVKAIVYTHVHGDHTGGSQLFVNESDGNIPIYAHAAWLERRKYDTSSVGPMISRRALSQMGVVLPEGLEGTVGAGIGPATRADGGSKFLPPNILVDESLKVTISGVRMELIHAAGDIDSHLLIWLPDDKVMFSGDVLGGTLPYIATPRYEPDRDPRKFMATLVKMLDYPIEFVAPGHGRPLLGRKDVLNVLHSNRDVIKFLADQVERYVVKGYTADDIIDELILPPHLANHPDLQARYHRLEWIIRGLFMKHAGWADETLTLSRHTDSEEAKRLVSLLGGKEVTLGHAQEALEAADPRWAAVLATYVLRNDADDKRAQEIKSRAFKSIAYTTDSANERNYLLTAVMEMESGIPWPLILQKDEMMKAASQTSSALLAAQAVRLKAERVLEDTLSIGVSIDDEEEVHTLLVTRGVLVHSTNQTFEPDARISMPRSVLNQLSARLSTWAKELDAGSIRVERGKGSKATAKRFAELIE